MDRSLVGGEGSAVHASGPDRGDACGRPVAPGELLLAVACIAASAAALEQVARSFAPKASWGVLATAALLLRVALGTAAAALVLRQPQSLARLRPGWPVLLPVALAGASVLWSVSPATSLRAATALVASTAAGVFLAARFSLEEQLRAVVLGLGLVAVASAAAAVLRPELGVMQELHAGAWRGVVGHKNLLGQTLAPLVVALLFLVLSGGLARGLGLAAGAAVLAVLAASRSLGAWLVSAGSVAWSLALLSARAGTRRRRVMGLGGAALAAVLLACMFAAAPEPASRLLGTDPTMNQRTAIWAASVVAARERPWLGHGFDAFWAGETPARETLVRSLGFFPWHAHNGLADLLLELGAVGLVAFGVPFAVFAAWSLRYGLGGSPRDLFPAAYLLLFALANLGESSLVRPSGVHWLLYVAAVGACVDLRRRGSGSDVVAA